MPDDRQLATARRGEVLDRPSGEVVRTDAASLMEVISRAASDPNTDVAKLERLMDLYERVEGRQFEREFNIAMSACQSGMEAVRKDAKSDKGKYASYGALDQAVRPIYTAHGFGLSYDTSEAKSPDDIRVLCYVTHASGGKREYHIDMPADGKGAKGGDVMTRTHAVGSAITYGRRYLLGSIFNIVVANDDDGAAAGREMSAACSAAMAAINAIDLKNIQGFKDWKVANADALQVMPTKEADAVIRLFNDRYKRAKDAAINGGAS